MPESQPVSPDSQVGRDKVLMVLSDLDYTLCGTYSFDASGRNHLPEINSELVAAADGHDLLIATGRRAHNPAIPRLWESGLVPPSQPVITENGGSLAFYDDGQLSFLDLVPPEDLTDLAPAGQRIAAEIDDVPDGRDLVVKMGRTMLVVQLQGEDGTVDPSDHAWLAERVNGLLGDTSLRAVDTQASVTVQHRNVNKATAFLTYLDLVGIDRNKVRLVGLGDAHNDKEIFDEADFAIGVGPTVAGMVDMSLAGPHQAPDILRSLRKARTATAAAAASPTE